MEAVTDEGPRLTRKGRATRQRIVEAAAQLMFERGVAGTSTEDVRAAAGVSSSQLYHYFASKQHLVRAVIAHQTEAVLAAQEPQLSRLDCMGALEAWRDLVVALQTQRGCEGGCPLGSLAAELSEIDPDARQELVAGFARWEAAIRDGLTAMQRRGELSARADPGLLALQTLTAVQGGLLLTQVRRDVDPVRAGLDMALSHIRTFLI
ncbi:TetR/AcrR family transcriptional regulator [Pseudonocardia benzenivorans]|jgi:AcrR family transcriptional regulator|uniref:TetR/AcrR family transcriptional regulator n=1 Tax=Pseudonocardia benzenivorans TaxID=228005 RepID=A0ABW3VKZ0_9PSEU|nr:TetR/AcrR family transcriptional regulator [Pseudonocardia dioxanivorans]GJF06241.1 transcriptional regulator [Pseudonocardia sp. D17]